MSPTKLKEWFDRYALWSISTYRAGGLALPVIGLMLLLLFLPKVWGFELPTVVVIGAPMAIFAAVMLRGLEVERRGKRRRRPKTTNR
ncbi:hypothetical protein [Brevundimonas sp.]|uniref:hypothetical protein n=1 Tax=Brevundimonas sp. TaxID=1871086 RepID=UPI002EDB6D40